MGIFSKTENQTIPDEFLEPGVSSVESALERYSETHQTNKKLVINTASEYEAPTALKIDDYANNANSDDDDDAVAHQQAMISHGTAFVNSLKDILNTYNEKINANDNYVWKIVRAAATPKVQSG